MTDMREDERERIGRLANEICGCSTLEQHRRDIALIEAEIDRRVAEEKAKLLERLREPSEGMMDAARKAVVSYAFHECQPDNGHIFSWIDDRAQEIAEAVLSAIKEQHHD